MGLDFRRFCLSIVDCTERFVTFFFVLLDFVILSLPILNSILFPGLGRVCRK